MDTIATYYGIPVNSRDDVDKIYRRYRNEVPSAENIDILWSQIMMHQITSRRNSGRCGYCGVKYSQETGLCTACGAPL